MPNHVKNTTIVGPFNLLAPHSCRGCGLMGNVLCERCKKHILSTRTNLCPICKQPNPTGKCLKCSSFPPSFIVSERTDLIDYLIHDYKYHSVRAIAHPLATLLDYALPPFPGQVNIIPLPTIGHHIHERGFDHIQLIAKNLAKIRGQNYQVTNLLLRHQNTIQVGSNRATRLMQAKNAYRVSPKTHIDPTKTYLLLDDVWTTGASMQAAIEKIRHAGITDINVALLALSRV